MTGESLKYLCAVLNSTLIRWFLQQIAPPREWEHYDGKRFTLNGLPIPRITAAEQRPLVRLVDEILEAKAADPDEDTGHLEREIDQLVYDLYGLTEEEDTAVDRSLGLIHASDEEEDNALALAMDEVLADERVSGRT